MNEFKGYDVSAPYVRDGRWYEMVRVDAMTEFEREVTAPANAAPEKPNAKHPEADSGQRAGGNRL